MFASEIGTPLDARNVTHKHFKPLPGRVGLPDIRFHDPRHTCATLLLARGTHPKHLQELLEHTSSRLPISVLQDRDYASILDANLRERPYYEVR